MRRYAPTASAVAVNGGPLDTSGAVGGASPPPLRAHHGQRCESFGGWQSAQADLPGAQSLLADRQHLAGHGEGLAVVLDRVARWVVGWAMRPSLEQSLTLAAFPHACPRRTVAPGVRHHRDRGSQYPSGASQAALARAQRMGACAGRGTAGTMRLWSAAVPRCRRNSRRPGWPATPQPDGRYATLSRAVTIPSAVMRAWAIVARSRSNASG
ncbi:MAG: hypothetical protein MI924_37270 [Chloroflexales bacterium]|nr:hypothetical protein [Chloroflexales bacterium]